MEIFKLLKANIKHKKGAFKSIAALMAIIVFSFSGTVSNNDNLARSIDRAHAYANTPTFNAMERVTLMQEDLVETVSAHPDVVSVTATDCVLAGGTKADGNEVFQNLFVYEQGHDIYRVMNDTFTDYAENPAPLKEGEVYVPYGMTAVTKLEIGSTLTMGTEDYVYEFTVKGFVEEPQFGASLMGIKRVFVHENDFKKMYDEACDVGTHKTLDVGVTLADNADYSKVKKELDDSCGLAASAALVMSKEETITYTELYSRTGSGILLAFLILLIAIVIISMWHSISTSIDMEYTNLGILKSQGFTSWQIQIVYVLQYFIAEVIGSVIGLLLSVPALKLLGMLFQPMTGLLTATDISFVKCGAMALALALLCIMFVVIATNKVGRISPVRAISGGKAEVYFDSRLNLPIKAKPLSFFMGLRQFTSRFKSYGGSVLIVALLVYFMMTVTILSDTLSREYFGETQFFQNITLILNEDFDLDKMEDFEQTVAEIDPDARTLFNFSDYIMIDGIQLYCNSYNKPDMLNKVYEGRMPIYDNEVAVTEIASELLGKVIGDTVVIGSNEDAKEFIVTGIYQNVNDAGKNITITSDGLYRINKTIPMFYVEMADLSLTNKVAEVLEEKYSEHILRKHVEEERNTSADGIFELIDTICVVIVAVVYGISIIFSAVVISMICSKAFIKERTDIGILKSLGFTASGLRTQFASRFTIIAAIGSIVGGIASMFLTTPLLEVIMRMVGLTRIDADITLFTFLIPALAVCASFFLFAYVAARKINTVEVRELISE
ncbi:MAG: FtsX-like permease family protein [Oscillospiraceae bacterium]|nr:FtsX-like permease family protein [Oscillospiraceae bacterium]